jgi:uncharacterized protein
VIYVDSSVLLAIYLTRPQAGDARGILALPEPKVASWLLAVEVPVVLRRALGGRPADRRLLDRALGAFDADCRAVHLYDGLPDVAARVRSDQRFSRCRAFDAVHLATAVLVREETGAAVQIATFDEALRTAATTFALPLLPA